VSRRRFHTLALSGAVLAAACARDHPPAVDSSRTAAAALPAPVTATFTGLGGIRIGQSRGDVGAMLGDTSRAGVRRAESCDYLRSARLPAGVKLMLQRDTVVRVDVDSGAVRTVEGAGIGDAESRVLATYAGRVTVQPHKYTGPAGHYLIVDDPADSLRRIVFETDGALVTRYRVGARPAVDLVEGCG
jgi:hypothetical protein